MKYQAFDDRIVRTEDKRYLPVLKVATFGILPFAIAVPVYSFAHWHTAITVISSVLSVLFLLVYLVAIFESDLEWKEPFRTTKVKLNNHLYNVIQQKHMWNPTYANAVETLFSIIHEDKKADARVWRATFEAMNEELAPITKERQHRELINPDKEAYLYEIREFKKLMDKTSGTL